MLKLLDVLKISEAELKNYKVHFAIGATDKMVPYHKFLFKYSILEVCNMNLGNDYIIGRESYWKEVLQTREFGLNKN